MIKLNFKGAVAASVVWHMLIGSVFNVVILPSSYEKQDFTQIAFLGSILMEDASLNVDIRERPIFTDVQHERTAKFIDRFNISLSRLQRHIPEEDANKLLQAKYDVRMDDFVNIEKRLPRFKLSQSGGDYSPSISNIKGPAGRRDILYKPELPSVVHWPPRLEDDLYVDTFNVELKFYVLPDGKVGFVERASSCGYTEIDIMAMRYMKLWQFEPIASGTEKQWGKVWLKFSQK